MVKSELINRIAEKQPSLLLKDVELGVNHIIECMSDALSQGERIEIRGFGSFSVREYEGYSGRNPKTGEKVEVKPKKLPFFKPGKDLAERVNKVS